MANVKYLSYDGLTHYTEKLFEIIDENERVTSKALTDLNTRLDTLDTHTHSYLPLSGGTMSGTINSQSIIPTTNTTYNLGSSSNQFNTIYTRYVDTTSGYNLRLKAAGVEHINMYSGNVNTTANIIPTVNGTYNLGSSSLKWLNVYATSFNGNLTGNADTATIAKTLPHFKIISNGTLPSDSLPEYVKFATITIPTTAWVRKSVTLIFQDYETNGYQGDILTIQASSNANGVGSTPSVKWVTKYQKSTIENIIISKISDNVYDLYLEATILPYVTLRIFYLTLDDVGQDKTFYFINNASSWSTTAPDPITARSTLNNVASEFGSARTLWGQSFNGTANVSGDMSGVGSISMSKALTINGSDADTANLHFGRTSYNYITGPAGSAIHMCPGGISKSANAGYVFSSSAFYPGTTNAYSIGSSSKQWNNIYGKTLYENGTSLANKYAQISKSFITNRDATDNLTSDQITAYADLSTSSAGQTAFKVLKSGSYSVGRSGYSELLINLGTNSGSSSALEFLTNYHHNDRLRVRKVIDSNRVSGEFKELAWYSDIPTTLKNPNSLTIQANGTTIGTYDGSGTVTANITAASLGLSKVFDYKGITTTSLSDGLTNQTIKINNIDYKAKTGDVVIVNGDTDKEYFWNGSKWEELGRTIDLSGYSLITHTHTQYAPTSHTHAYAGSDSVGGPANNVKIVNGSGDSERNIVVGYNNAVYSVPNVTANYSKGSITAKTIKATETVAVGSSFITYNQTTGCLEITA